MIRVIVQEPTLRLLAATRKIVNPTPSYTATRSDSMSLLDQKRDAERRRLESLIPSEDDPHSGIKGVLLSDEIIFYSENHHLISPFDRENLKPAGYELTVGNEYFLSGEFLTLDSANASDAKITIPSFEVAVIKTGETLCLPRYLIARWNIRVKHAYSGLLWVGGPQVDAGYVGHLFCPIYNLSDKPVTLQLGEPLALMDFVKTSPFEKSKANTELKRYRWPPKRLIIEDYPIDDLRSALFTKAASRLEEFDEAIRGLETRFITFTQISFGIFGLVIALVSIASRAVDRDISFGASVWGAVTVGISVAALLISIFSYLQWRVGRFVSERYGIVMAKRAREVQRFLRRSWLSAVFLSVVLSISGGVAVYMLSEPFFRDVRQQRVLTRSDLESSVAPVSTTLQDIRDRLQRIEKGGFIKAEDLEILKKELDRKMKEIQSLPK